MHLEAREEKDLLALERVQARKSKRPPRPRVSAGEKEKKSSVHPGGGDVHPGQVEALEKVLFAVERVQAR